MNNITFKLAGLTCKACVTLVANRFKKISGVHEVSIDLPSGMARVASSGYLDLKILAKSLEDSQYSIIKQ